MELLGMVNDYDAGECLLFDTGLRRSVQKTSSMHGNVAAL